jgi:hypothetical protein
LTPAAVTQRFVLIVPNRGGSALSREPIVHCLATLRGEALTPSVHLLPVGFEQGDELRRIAARCRRDEIPLWLLAELPPDPPDRPGLYRRLHDRSGQHDAELAAWRSGRGPLPALAAGEMVRL